MIFLVSASLVINILLLFGLAKLRLEFETYKLDTDCYLENALDYLLRHEEEMEDLHLDTQMKYFDFLNYLHKTWHLRQDINGQFHPSRYEWGEQEELRLLYLKDFIDKEFESRGISRPPSMEHLEGLN